MADIKIDISVNQQKAQRQIDNLRKSLTKTDKAAKNANKSIGIMGAAIGSFAGNVAAIGFLRLTRGIAGLVTSSVKVTGELETLRTQFEVLTGSVGEANKAVRDLQEFAARTPFQFKDLAKAQQRLLSFGFTLEETQDRMKDIGDVAAASGADISELALIFGQVKAAGKLTGERLLQFQERAIPIGPALAKSLGVAESSIKDLVSAGKVQFSDFEKAFRTLNDTGQFAFEGMIKRSRTLEGRISTLKDNFELLQAGIGTKLAPAFKAILTTMTLFIQKLQESAGFKDFLNFIGNNIPTAIEAAINSFSFMINSIFNVIKGFNLFRSGVATAISIIIQSFGLLIEGFVKVADALGLGDTALGRSLKSVKEFKDGVVTSLDDTAEGFAESAAAIDASQNKVNDAIKNGKDFIISTLKEETAAAEEQANAKEEIDQRKIDSEKNVSAEHAAELEKRKAAEAKLREALMLAEEEVAVQREANLLFEQEQEQIFTDERLIALEDRFTREEEARIQAGINAAANETQKQILINKAVKQGLDNKLKITAKAKRDEEKLDRAKTRALLQGSAGMFGALASLARQGGAKQFGIMKALAKAQVITNGIAAVSEAARQPYPINIPLTIKAVAEGVARLSAINSQQPSFEQGGIVPGTSFTGDNVSANVNSGEMILNRQQQSNLFSLANNGQGSNGSQPMNITVQSVLDGELVAESVSQWVANGGQLGEVQ